MWLTPAHLQTAFLCTAPHWQDGNTTGAASSATIKFLSLFKKKRKEKHVWEGEEIIRSALGHEGHLYPRSLITCQSQNVKEHSLQCGTSRTQDANRAMWKQWNFKARAQGRGVEEAVAAPGTEQPQNSAFPCPKALRSCTQGRGCLLLVLLSGHGGSR